MRRSAGPTGRFAQLNEAKQVLKTTIESGSLAEEFRNATAAAEFREGDGLCGGAWKARDVVFIPDFGSMTGPGYKRAAIAKQHGIRAAMCFPIVVDEKVVGTMDFFLRWRCSTCLKGGSRRCAARGGWSPPPSTPCELPIKPQ